MTLQHEPSIKDFFDYRERGSEEPFSMYQWVNDSNDRLYVVNQHSKKLLQFIVKDENTHKDVTFAQIKIIPYAIERVKVYKDQPGDPHLHHCQSALNFDPPQACFLTHPQQ